MMFWKRKPKMPWPVTVNDCVLLWQMGYEVEVSNGHVISIRKKKKRKKIHALGNENG